MLIQICKLAGFGPIVAVVGGAHKIDVCLQLGMYTCAVERDCFSNVCRYITLVVDFYNNLNHVHQDTYNNTRSAVTYNNNSNIKHSKLFIYQIFFFRS